MRASTNKISINNAMLALEILTLILRRKAIIINHFTSVTKSLFILLIKLLHSLLVLLQCACGNE